MKSYTYRNAEILRDLPKLKFLKKELKQTKWQIDDLHRQIKNLEKQRTQQESEIESLDAVTEIFEGIAICSPLYDYGDDRIEVCAVDQSIERSASAYVAADSISRGGKEPDHWGLNFRSRDAAGYGQREDWQGLGWSKKDVQRLAKRWVALGERPTKEHVEMCRVRHRLDPDGTAPRQRQDAFEAAWLAGHHDLAKQLLSERVRPRKRKRPKKISKADGCLQWSGASP